MSRTHRKVLNTISTKTECAKPAPAEDLILPGLSVYGIPYMPDEHELTVEVKTKKKKRKQKNRHSFSHDIDTPAERTRIISEPVAKNRRLSILGQVEHASSLSQRSFTEFSTLYREHRIQLNKH